jgi:hypothetical protein
MDLWGRMVAIRSAGRSGQTAMRRAAPDLRKRVNSSTGERAEGTRFSGLDKNIPCEDIVRSTCLPMALARPSADTAARSVSPSTAKGAVTTNVASLPRAGLRQISGSYQITRGSLAPRGVRSEKPGAKILPAGERGTGSSSAAASLRGAPLSAFLRQSFLPAHGLRRAFVRRWVWSGRARYRLPSSA